MDFVIRKNIVAKLQLDDLYSLMILNTWLLTNTFPRQCFKNWAHSHLQKLWIIWKVITKKAQNRDWKKKKNKQKEPKQESNARHLSLWLEGRIGTLFIEIDGNGNKNIVVGLVYKISLYDDDIFIGEEETLMEYFIFSYFKIELLRFNQLNTFEGSL